MVLGLRARRRRLGVSPLADQQIAGLLMWGFGGLAPVAAGAALLVAWLDRLERYPRTSAPSP